jgi:hypothetical protein
MVGPLVRPLASTDSQADVKRSRLDANGEAPENHFNTDEEKARNQKIPVANHLEVVHDRDMTFANIIKGTAANPLTNFERKAALINL